MFRRVAVVFMVLLFVIGVTVLTRTPSEAAAPRRIEVSVTPAGSGQSNIRLQWEGSFTVQRLSSINANGDTSWSTLASGVTTFNQDVDDYRNYVYRVGDGITWQEARVYPPKESAHTNYSMNSDTCKGCHRTHYAVHKKLLSHRIVFELCITCHGDSTGSKYNVLTGMTRIGPGTNDVVGSPAGAFSTAGTTSYHNVFLEAEGEEFSAPGGSKMTLTCTDCHSAHVTPDSSPFRLLKLIGSGPVDAYSVANGSSYTTVYRRYMNDFCSSCHALYNYNTHAMTDSWPDGKRRGDGIKAHPSSGDIYRHPTDLDIKKWLADRGLTTTMSLPLEKRVEGSQSVHRLSCITCHMAHGTKVSGVQVSPEPGVVKIDKDGQAVPNSTMLKRTGYMSVCMECHLDISFVQ
ncbi:MAG: hypothetical protein KGZ63_07285 [Clostridiales bacterium]|nr:hypothetical protein [Clostridiales bacterium]